MKLPSDVIIITQQQKHARRSFTVAVKVTTTISGAWMIVHQHVNHLPAHRLCAQCSVPMGLRGTTMDVKSVVVATRARYVMKSIVNYP